MKDIKVKVLADYLHVLEDSIIIDDGYNSEFSCNGVSYRIYNSIEIEEYFLDFKENEIQHYKALLDRYVPKLIDYIDWDGYFSDFEYEDLDVIRHTYKGEDYFIEEI